MKEANLKNMTVAELVQLFTNIGLKQFQAELRSEQKKLNSAMFEMFDVVEELKKRPGDQRSELLTLYNHPNLQVRLMAARLTLAVAPEASRKMLQKIADSKEYPQAMDAGMSL